MNLMDDSGQAWGEIPRCGVALVATLGGTMSIELSKMKYAYKSGNNPAGETAYYYCHECGLELYAEQVGYVVAGTNYANGEFAQCPLCGSENVVHRDQESLDV
jgi:rubrerythrin